MTYEQWMEICGELKKLHEKVDAVRKQDLDSKTVHAAMMVADQAKWTADIIHDMVYSTAVHTFQQ